MSALSRVTLTPFLLLALMACEKEKEKPVEKPFVYSTVSTLAGSGTEGYGDGSGSSARFSYPEGVAVDGQGNLYVADAGNSCIRRITPAGVVSTFAGSPTEGFANGAGLSATFRGPIDVAFDTQGNLYVADGGNHAIRKVTPAGVVSTLAGTGTAGTTDGPGATAQFNTPNGLAVDAQGNVYVADYSNFRIRKITPAGVVSTLAGGQYGFADGAGTAAQFQGPEGIAVDGQGILYVADFNGGRIRKIMPDGTVSTLSGTGVPGFADGAGATAQFKGPTGITLDAQGNLLVADIGNNCIRRVTLAGEVSTLAGTRTAGGTDGPVGAAQFDTPSGIVAGSKALYVTEFGHRIRKITAE